MPNSKNKQYILTAQDDDHDHKEDAKDRKIAALQKAMDEKEHELKDAKAKLNAKHGDHVPDPHAPEVRDLKSKIASIIATAMHEDDEHHMHANDDDDDHDKKVAKAVTAIMKVFDEGNGTQIGNPTEFETRPKTADTQGEPATVVQEAKTAALIAKLSKKAAQPMITEILTAKTLKGASEDVIKADEKRLRNMSLTAVEHEYEAQKIFIQDALKASKESLDQKALTAKQESTFDFNGVALYAGVSGSEFSIDKALQGVN